MALLRTWVQAKNGLWLPKGRTSSRAPGYLLCIEGKSAQNEKIQTFMGSGQWPERKRIRSITGKSEVWTYKQT